MKKKVWILNHYALEPGSAGGTRHFSLARHLLHQGWETSLIAASVELNTGRQRLTPNEKNRVDIYDGVKFLWIKTPKYKGNGGGRMRNMLSYSFKVLLPSSLKKLDRPDVIIGSSVHPFAAWSAAILSSRYKVPFIFEVRDLWPQTLIDLGRLSKNGVMTKLLQYLEKWLYRRADKIVVLLPKANEYIEPLGITADKIIWIPNGVELEGYPELKQEKTFERDDFTLMYFGAHGQANGLDILIEAMAELKRKAAKSKVYLRMIGEGPLKQQLQEQVKELELDNITFEDPVPKSDIPLIAQQADAFVLLVKDLPNLYCYGISMNKMFDYFAAAKPIVMASAAMNNPVDEAAGGITVPPDNSAALASAITELVNMPPGKRKKMGESGREFVKKHHGFDVLSIKLASVLDEVVRHQ